MKSSRCPLKREIKKEFCANWSRQIENRIKQEADRARQRQIKGRQKQTEESRGRQEADRSIKRNTEADRSVPNALFELRKAAEDVITHVE
jgi:hypothetical protein